MPIDETKYEMTDVSKDVFNNLYNKLFGTDIILMLLSVSKIKGKIVLQKQVFLTWKELFFNKTVDLGYIPYQYGAYSKQIADSLKYLDSTDFIKIIKGKGERTEYHITTKGQDKIQNKIKSIGVNMTELKIKKQDWDEWDKEGIMRYTYRKFPEYTSESKMGSFKWPSQ